MDDRLKLAQGLRNLPAAAREDLAGRAADIERGKTVELLRRAGKEMYDNPIVNTAIGFTPVLGDVQAAGETMAALNRGAPWQETAGYAAGMLPFVPMIGKTVWHGSPYTFDKFDLSKIGTGEGAQAYGHGLYLAEAKPTAQEYATNLSKELFNVGGELFDPADIKHLNVRTIARKGDIDSAINKATELAASDSPVADLARLDLDLLQQAKAKGGFQEAHGNLYKVDLPDEQIAKMLDWDKTLSEQPEVLKATQKLVEDLGELYPSVKEVMATPQIFEGQHLYQAMINSEKSPERASRSLNAIGIPGIQYLDQASRGAGEGTRNYVVFSDEIPQILERNNIPVNK